MKVISARKEYSVDVLFKDGSAEKRTCQARSADEAIEYTKNKLGKKLPKVRQLKTQYSDGVGIAGTKAVTFHEAPNAQNIPRA